MNTLGIFLAVLCILAGLGLLAYKRYHNPFPQTQRLANQANPEAQYQLGRFFYEGKHITKDYKQALYWLTQAAAQNHISAKLALAALYNDSKLDTLKNPQKAFSIYQEVAQTGNFEARINLAICYLKGIGTPQNEKQGFQILLQAANEKSPLAQTLVGDLYERGVGVEKDEQTAMRYYLWAARKGEPFSKHKITLLQQKINRNRS